MTFTSLRRQLRSLASLGTLSFVLALAASPTFAADTPANGAASAEADTIVSTKPMEFEADEGNAHGDLTVPPEVLGAETIPHLFFTITANPQHGQVGLAGGDDADFFKNTSSRQGYFVYRSDDNYEGTDSFSYSVRNETTGLVFKNNVVITVNVRHRWCWINSRSKPPRTVR